MKTVIKTDVQVRNLKAKDKNYKAPVDCGGLYLLVNTKGSKYWRYNYRLNGKQKTASLGTYPEVSLKEAKQAYWDIKKLVKQGIDPVREKRKAKQEASQASNTLEGMARAWHKAQIDRWSPKHANRVISALEKRVFPYIGALPIAEVEAPDILDVLRKMEAEGLGDSTRRLKQHLGLIFTFAIAEGRLSFNPVNGLEHALKPTPEVQHRRYLKPSQLGHFMRHLDQYEGDIQTRLAIELIVYTFVRSGELRQAEWSEFDFDKALWTIPAEHMKMKDPHLVPLSKQAIAVLEQLKELNGDKKLILPSISRANKPISEGTMLGAIRRMGFHSNTTIHGFRSTASTALNEAGFNSDVIERQLSHMERNKIRAAYNHAQYIEKRTKMMQWWADKVDSLKADNNVIVGNFN